MGKDKDNSLFDFDNDPKFNESFYQNIEKALGDSNSVEEKPEDSINIEAEEKSVDHQEIAINDNKVLNSKKSKKAYEQQVEEADETVAGREDVKEKVSDKLKEELDQKDAGEKAVGQKASGENIADMKISDEKNIDEKNIDEKDSDDVKVEDDEFDEKLSDINNSLAKQISDELDNITLNKMSWKKRFFRIRSGVALTLLSLLGIFFFLGGTEPGNKLLIRMGVNMSGPVWELFTRDFKESTDVTADVDYLTKDDKKSTAPEIDPSTIIWPDHPGEGRQEDGVYNILLLGEEAIGMGDSRGRTDSIVIATLNTNNKSVKLTSLMRDTFVQIPGFNDNKLNSAYEKGGLDLLYETISMNFDIKLDGCVMVNFDNFEKIVDDIGGLDLTLTQGEADYLNTTNYISKKQYRTIVEGTQHLNGNQVLGYSRIRKISTITGNNNDYGRTDRHRIVLNAIYEKCKTRGKTELVYLLFKFLPMITTDIDSDNFQMLLNSYLDMGMSTTKMEQLRIPVDGAFQDNLRVRGMAVVIPDLPKNIIALHSFIFGDAIPTVTVSPEADSSNTTTNTDSTGN